MTVQEINFLCSKLINHYHLYATSRNKISISYEVFRRKQRLSLKLGENNVFPYVLTALNIINGLH